MRTWKLKLLRQTDPWSVNPVVLQEVQVVGVPMQETHGEVQAAEQLRGPLAPLPVKDPLC